MASEGRGRLALPSSFGLQELNLAPQHMDLLIDHVTLQILTRLMTDVNPPEEPSQNYFGGLGFILADCIPMNGPQLLISSSSSHSSFSKRNAPKQGNHKIQIMSF